ncbi:ribokinase [Pleomorphovibrio marinus]|uniref:ribokinase n=1 Tax=Pleomorphovibrio marinus TaxID=2164132 RepID=UPI000E0AC97C|nr:ribokinase [Pleomorphovibrio marinus]
MGKILIIGSTNTDMVIVADHFPAPGETIIGGTFLMNPGGKGANQAVAAARLGGEVAFISKVGQDVFGQQAIQNLKNEGIDTTGVAIDPEEPSGVAQITVDKSAENCIVVAPGANMALSREDLEKRMGLIESAEIVLAQLEVPLSTISFALARAYEMGKKTILNPAPAVPLPDDLYKSLYMITPNQSEAEILTGIKVTDEKSSKMAAEWFLRKGVKVVIITLGADGAFLYDGNEEIQLPAPKVKAVDTTAAGDTFNGALAVAIAKKWSLKDALAFANKAAAQTVTKMGAQSSIPFWREL